MSRSNVQFYLNGKLQVVDGEEAFLPFSSFLRYRKNLTGTKVVCAEGDCGACTIMLRRTRPDGTKDSFKPVNCCILTTFLLDGCEVVTVEGLTDADPRNEVQASMIRNFGGQCGFCTPGFVMAITGMLEQEETLSEQKVKNHLTGNLCRCTGYKPIIESVLDIDRSKIRKIKELFESSFEQGHFSKAVVIESKDFAFYAPTSLDEAAEFLNNNQKARIFSGATDLGVQINKGKDPGRKLMSLHLIPEVYELALKSDTLTLGARVTLGEFEEFIKDHIPAFSEFLHIFASPQIKNTGTLVGNIANASPIADTTPVFMSLETKVNVFGRYGARSVPINEFYKGYKELDLNPDEFIVSLSFSVPPKNNRIYNYKVSQRRDLDISCVNACFNFKLENNVIQNSRISLGGVAATTIRATNLESFLNGKDISEKTLEEAKVEVGNSISPLSDLRGSKEFRVQVIQNLLEKFFREHLL